MTEEFIIDACAGIDLFEVDQRLFRVLSRSVGKLNVVVPVLKEITGLSQSRAVALGLCVVMPELAILDEAAAVRGSLSFEDRVCLLVARQRGWTCVSNDRALRAECARSNVPVLWGLDLLALAVASGSMRAAHALRTAKAIQKQNPFIRDEVIVQFEERIRPKRK